MTTLVTISLACTLVAILFAVIACDEARRLGRKLADLSDELQTEREERQDLDSVVAGFMQRHAAQAPRRRGQDLPPIPSTHPSMQQHRTAGPTGLRLVEQDGGDQR